MQIEEIRKLKPQLDRIALKFGIRKIYIFGSVARGESTEFSDIDFLIELETGASPFGIGAFQFETQKLLGIHTDVVPTFALPNVEDKNFVQSIQAEAVAI